MCAKLSTTVIVNPAPTDGCCEICLLERPLMKLFEDYAGEGSIGAVWYC